MYESRKVQSSVKRFYMKKDGVKRYPCESNRECRGSRTCTLKYPKGTLSDDGDKMNQGEASWNDLTTTYCEGDDGCAAKWANVTGDFKPVSNRQYVKGSPVVCFYKYPNMCPGTQKCKYGSCVAA